MFEDLDFFPRAASSVADDIDGIYLFLVGMTAFAAALIFATLVFFGVRYHRRKGHRAQEIEGSVPLEILWSAVPLLLFLFLFGWNAKVYLGMHREPADCLEYFVTGKQWMWKIQHPTGQREINTLHVPTGRPVRLTMISEDVIHSFYVPAFRIKRDVLPGMYSSIWFEATEVGRYHLFCAEYCGTKHSEMIGEVVVLDPADYEAWLAGQPASADPVETGRVLFENLRCITCHDAGPEQRGPNLAGRFGSEIPGAGGQPRLFDGEYVRESMLDPNRVKSPGYESAPPMPTYAGQVTEVQIQHLTAYIAAMEAEEEQP